MGETAESLYRRGAISPKQAAKLGVLKKTKVERPDEEEFHGKQGARDQGAGKERGHKVGGVKHIDTKQEMGSKARASGEPSKGGRVNAYGQPGTDEIDQGIGGGNRKEFPKAGGSTKASKGGRDGAEWSDGVNELSERGNQKPDFPNEGSYKKGSSKGPSNKKAKGRVPAQGGQYGGGGRNTQ